MTCDHTAKPLAMAPIHEIQDRKPTEGVIGQQVVCTATWAWTSKGLFCYVCGEQGPAMPEAVEVSFAGRLAVRWDDENQCWRWREVKPLKNTAVREDVAVVAAREAYDAARTEAAEVRAVAREARAVAEAASAKAYNAEAAKDNAFRAYTRAKAAAADAYDEIEKRKAGG